MASITWTGACSKPFTDQLIVAAYDTQLPTDWIENGEAAYIGRIGSFARLSLNRDTTGVLLGLATSAGETGIPAGPQPHQHSRIRPDHNV